MQLHGSFKCKEPSVLYQAYNYVNSSRSCTNFNFPVISLNFTITCFNQFHYKYRTHTLSAFFFSYIFFSQFKLFLNSLLIILDFYQHIAFNVAFDTILKVKFKMFDVMKQIMGDVLIMCSKHMGSFKNTIRQIDAKQNF